MNCALLANKPLLGYNKLYGRFPTEERMDQLQNSKEKLKYGRLCFWLILAMGIFARVFQFGSIPGGINQDEAFAAYEAW